MFKSYIKKGKVFIIAEVSANHAHSFSLAADSIRVAKECGANAVKFQTYTPDTSTIDVDNKYFRIRHAKWGRRTLYDLYREAYTPWNWFPKLKRIAKKEGIIFCSTAYDRTAVDFLEDIGVPFHKISSFELVDTPFIEYVAGKRRPIIMSTGMASTEEIGNALKSARQGGAREIVLLKCTSSYPAEPSEIHLNTIADMKKRFGLPVGLSDHTAGIAASVAAVALGAVIVEKHFIVSRSVRSADNFFSLEPKEFSALVKNIRLCEKMLGSVHYGMTAGETASKVFRRSLFAVEEIKKGELFTERNVRSIRPSYGLSPCFIGSVLGRIAACRIRKGTPLSWDFIEK